MMKRSGKLDLEHDVRPAWSIVSIQEKQKQLAHVLRWRSGEAFSDSKRLFNPAKNGRKKHNGLKLWLDKFTLERKQSFIIAKI